MRLLKSIADVLEKAQAVNYSLPVVQQRGFPDIRQIGNELTVYPADNGERYITKGYNGNDAVFSIVSQNAEKAGQVRLYHVKIKREEKKTRQEYEWLQKQAVTPQSLKEMQRMRKAMIEDNVIDSPISKLLNKPTRYQTQSEWIEQMFALRELQGEGNLWFVRSEDRKRILEMMVIPKPHLSLIGTGRDPWTVLGYEFNIDGATYRWETSDVLMWKYSNPKALSNTLDHLRGLAPLQAAMILLQGMNEGDLRVATSNKNAGANGFAFRKDAHQQPTPEQMAQTRASFNNAVNSSEMVNKVAIVAGEWGYYNLGFSVEAQKLLEQYGYGFKRLCRVFKTPPGIFSEGNDTYENQKQYERKWIYSKIAPNMYHLRGLLSDKLISEFALDPETNMIDCDVMSLPEMAQDLKEQVAAVKDAWWLTPNQKLSATNYETVNDPDMDKIYIPSGYQTLEQLNADLGEPLDLNNLNL